MANDFNIPNNPIPASSPSLVIKSFGLQFLKTEIYKGKIPIAVRDKSQIDRKSSLGTAIFSDLQFRSIVDIGAHVPVDTVLMDVKQAKNIVRTTVNGRDGQIKQYLGEDDFEISVKGVICGPNGQYPFDKVKNLVNFFRYNQSLGIVSKYLNEMFDINEVVVKEYFFEQPEGSQFYQKFEATFWSEKPVEILIQEGK